MGTGMAMRGVEASSSKTYMQEVRGATLRLSPITPTICNGC